jgi:uncharacterized membrane protein
MNDISGSSPVPPFDHSEHERLHPVFGPDRFGQVAERIARFFGTPRYILGQSVMVVIWIIFNAVAFSLRWDPYPFILLNLAFSTQAAYAAPLILLAQTRQADRDKATEAAAANHRDAIATAQQQLLEQNTRLTEEAARLTKQIDELTRAIHKRVVEQAG